MSHHRAVPVAAPSADPEALTFSTASKPAFVDPAGRSALAVTGAIAVGVAGLLLFAAAIMFHPGWLIPLAEAGVVAVFSGLFLATR